MQPILTPAEMAEADARTIAAGTSVDVLMERAGHAVAWEVRKLLGNAYGKRVVVVCGKGNNGGDGLVAARVLRGWGVRTEVFELEGSGSKGVPEAAFDRALERADLLIDAMFGTGLRGALEGDAALVARRSADIATVAVDIPSGVDGLTGAVHGDAVQAVATVTFAARKLGLVFEPGRGRSGNVIVADIGIDVNDASIGFTEADDVRAWLSSAPELEDSHKWKSGLLVVGGSGGMTGAPLMASHAAMRSGAGIVWCAVPGADAASCASGSEVITKAMPADANGALIGVSHDVRDALSKFHAAVVGPGLGMSGLTRGVVRDLVCTLPLPLVLDADGINAFAGEPDLLQQRPAPTVITPHEGEFARLLGEAVGDDRIAAARKLAAATGCIGLLKGPGTVVAHPDGRVAVNGMDGPWLATAGSGDVLTGIIGGFLARGLEGFEAAVAGAFVHGLAADVAGHTGLVAGDLVAALAQTLLALTPTL
ncbi:MAG: NAD(P)H-hydrate dehydratase [Acidimicrobiia bacterium]|nr:NAD(P)H-hydrate dehydratase [Acidimicrobiia bacterium]